MRRCFLADPQLFQTFESIQVDSRTYILKIHNNYTATYCWKLFYCPSILQPPSGWTWPGVAEGGWSQVPFQALGEELNSWKTPIAIYILQIEIETFIFHVTVNLKIKTSTPGRGLDITVLTVYLQGFYFSPLSHIANLFIYLGFFQNKYMGSGPFRKNCGTWIV